MSEINFGKAEFTPYSEKRWYHDSVVLISILHKEDKEQLDRIENRLDKLLKMLNNKDKKNGNRKSTRIRK